jgi:hypothetical protein
LSKAQAWLKNCLPVIPLKKKYFPKPNLTPKKGRFKDAYESLIKSIEIIQKEESELKYERKDQEENLRANLDLDLSTS